MSTLKRMSSLCVLIGFLAVSPSSHASDPVEDYVTSFLQAHQVPGATVAFVREGKVEKEVVYGSSNVQLRTLVQRTTVFQLASVTKIFTAITLFRLEEAGRVNLDDQVSKYLPDLPKEWRTVSLRQLGTHTSGLPDIIASPDKPLSEEELGRTPDAALSYAESRPVSAPPGSQFTYDQTNYLLLSKVLEKICGLSFRDCVVRYVLNPAGMTQTSWGDARAIVPLRSNMYTALYGAQIQNGANLYSYPGYLDAAAGLNSDIVDMERLASALTSGKLLSAKELARMWEPARKPGGTVIDIAKDMGISGVVAPTSGWFYADNSDGKYERTFMAGGSAVSVLVLPKQRACVLVLTNLQAKDDPLPLAEGLAKFYFPALIPML